MLPVLSSESGHGPAAPAELVRRLRTGGPTLVALSGGVDSAVVAALAFEADPGGTSAATLTGPATSREEVDRARSVALAIGLRHVLVPVDPLAVPEYRANPKNRCYFCRRTEAAALRAHGRGTGIVRYVDGVHRDDLGDDRPGLRALAEAGFSHPLLDAGWGKAEVRSYAREVGLPNWDAPAESCLASRVAHGTPIDGPSLARIAEAERRIRGRGFRRVRVRIEPAGARIEVDPSEVDRLSQPAERGAVTDELRSLGFDAVRIDPRGYRVRANS